MKDPKQQHGNAKPQLHLIPPAGNEEQAVTIFLSTEGANVIADRMGLKSRSAVDAIRSRKTWAQATKGLTPPRRIKYQRRWHRRPNE